MDEDNQKQVVKSTIVKNQDSRKKTRESMIGMNMLASCYRITSLDNVKLRICRPYAFEYLSFVKSRWLHHKLFDIFSDEFDVFDKSYFKNAILKGHITVNNGKVPLDYVLKDNDHISHLIHRHEPPVLFYDAKEMIIDETDDFLIINKPPTIPVHPSGTYRFNSLTYILAKDLNYSKEIHPFYRLDRLVSGILIMAKNQPTSRFMSILMQNRKSGNHELFIEKSYIARVAGKFPKNFKEVEINLQKVYHSETLTDRTKTGEKEVQAYADRIGVFREPGIYPSLNDENEIIVNYPIKVQNAKLNHNVVDLNDGKPSQSKFKFIEYDEKSNTSLVSCQPMTGRTHQLRIHLNLIHFPIANDPNYGPIEVVNEFKNSREAKQLKVVKKNETEEAFASKEETQKIETSFDTNLFEIHQLEDELKQNCQYCADGGTKAEFSEAQLRHRGIWLHALNYHLKTKLIKVDKTEEELVVVEETKKYKKKKKKVGVKTPKDPLDLNYLAKPPSWCQVFPEFYKKHHRNEKIL